MVGIDDRAARRTSGSPAVRVVEDWHQALNDGEVERLVGSPART
jgi:hypothetical protein